MKIALVVLELFTSITALVGGLLFVLRPDGSLLGADPALLDGTPFTGWLVPGLLLMVVVGLGFLVAVVWLIRDVPRSTFVSIVAGIGLVVFEAVEFALIGFHPLQPIYGVVGLSIVVLAVRLSGRRSRS